MRLWAALEFFRAILSYYEIVSGHLWVVLGCFWPFPSCFWSFGVRFEVIPGHDKAISGPFQDHFELFQAVSSHSHIEVVSGHLRPLDAIVW